MVSQPGVRTYRRHDFCLGDGGVRQLQGSQTFAGGEGARVEKRQARQGEDVKDPFCFARRQQAESLLGRGYPAIDCRDADAFRIKDLLFRLRSTVELFR